ncbi:MAG: protein translocase subunit SecD [Leptospirales bacterium]|nr:protein translocase subunit SecD [Leptospirales bacterium]
MNEKSDLIFRSVLAGVVVLISILLLLPNFATQQLAIAFRSYYRDAAGQRVEVSAAEVQDFVQDRENGLRLYFPGAECLPAAEGAYGAERRCVLSGRFITSARINELVQAFPNLIDERDTKLLPHWSERLTGFWTERGFRDLRIKLGLDLQGGMRAVFRADFESYLQRIREKNEPEIRRVSDRLSQPGIDAEEKKELSNRLAVLQSELNLDAGRRLELLREAKTIIDKRLAAQGLTEPEVRAQPESESIAVDMPGAANSSEVLERIKDTTTVEYRIVNDDATNRVNSAPESAAALRSLRQIYASGRVDSFEVNQILADTAAKAGIKADEGRLFLLWRRPPGIEGRAAVPLEFRVLGPPVMDGSDMSYADAAVGQNSGYYEIHFRLTAAGAERFGDITAQNVNKQLAILWGDRVVSDPNIRGPIYGGSGQITGDFDQAEASEISGVIREGALPMPLEVISVSFVGPSLGQESIVNGVISIVLGFIVVVLFMLGYYKWSGAVAVVALFLNLVIMTAVLSLLGFTLTLPGFAGAILTVGMAVDANVIIYEKIKEDLRAGKAASVAVDSGFKSSLWTILDSNITTLIAALVLSRSEDGPIIGFAIVLFFGLITSMFTALFVSRLIFSWIQQLSAFRRLSIGYGFARQGGGR